MTLGLGDFFSPFFFLLRFLHLRFLVVFFFGDEAVLFISSLGSSNFEGPEVHESTESTEVFGFGLQFSMSSSSKFDGPGVLEFTGSTGVSGVGVVDTNNNG